MAQVAYLAAEDGLGQEPGNERALAAEVIADVAEEYDVAALANEVGNLAPAAGTGDIVVSERDDVRDAEVVAKFDHPVPERDSVLAIAASLRNG